jgi:hypothetical protein
MTLSVFREGPRGRLEIYTRPSGRVPFEEFRKQADEHLWEKFERVFGRFQQEGMGIASNGVFKPLAGRGKGVWEWKQFDHRLYAFRGPDYGEAARVVLLNGWVKDKAAPLGGGVEENRQIEKAIALRDECLTEAAWVEAPPAAAELEEPADLEEEEEAADEEVEEPQVAEEEEPGWVDLATVALRLGVRRKRLRKWIERGQLLAPDRTAERTVWWREENMETLRARVAKLKGPAAVEPPAALVESGPEPAGLTTHMVAERLGISKDALLRLVNKGAVMADDRRAWRGGNMTFFWRESSLPRLAETIAACYTKKLAPAVPAVSVERSTSMTAAVTRASLLEVAEQVIDGKSKLRDFAAKLGEYRRYASWLEAELKRVRG